MDSMRAQCLAYPSGLETALTISVPPWRIRVDEVTGAVHLPSASTRGRRDSLRRVSCAWCRRRVAFLVAMAT